MIRHSVKLTIEDKLETFKEHCRQAGLKATHQRTEIYRELASSEEHPDAETLFRKVQKRIPAISFDTVYRTLRVLVEKGVVSRVGPALDRSRFDANLLKHHHFICESCGLVRDFYAPQFDELTAPAPIREFGSPHSLQVEVRGICHTCRKRRKST